MDNPFSYPSLAFGSEGLELGAELNRYNSFHAPNYTLEADEDANEDTQKPLGPAVENENNPPSGGSDANGTNYVKYLTYTGIFALTLYMGYLFDKGEITSDILFPTFGS